MSEKIDPGAKREQRRFVRDVKQQRKAGVHPLTCFCKECVDQALTEDVGPTPPVPPMDGLWKVQLFLQEAGKIFNEIVDGRVRFWAVKYVQWLRDRALHNVTHPAPWIPEKDSNEDEQRTMKEYQERLDAVAQKHFGGKE